MLLAWAVSIIKLQLLKLTGVAGSVVVGVGIELLPP